MFHLFKLGLFNFLFLWGIWFVHFRSSFFRSSSTSTVSAFQPRGAVSRCPFKMLSQLLNRPTAIFANSLSIPNADCSALLIHGKQDGASSAAIHPRRFSTALHFSSSSSLGGAAAGPSSLPFDDYCHPVSSPKTKLYATTLEAPPTAETSAAAPLPRKIKKKASSADSLEVVVLGLSHHNAKVDVREKLAIPEDQWNEVAQRLASYDSIHEASVLSTCNRFEIYLAGTNQYEVIKDALQFLLDKSNGSLDQETLRRNLFLLSGEDAIWHLLRVSAGLDSLVVGEGQILAQVKKAYEHGIEGGQAAPAGKVISRLLNVAVAAGKRVRAETGISRGAVSISSAAAEFSAWKLAKEENAMPHAQTMAAARVTILGAGKMARLLLVHLSTQGIGRVTVVNRSLQRIEELRQEFPEMIIEGRLMANLWPTLRQTDIVYPSTASETTIINPTELAACMAARAEDRAQGGGEAGYVPGGLQIVDISVPRNVHPDCAAIPLVFSYNVDDLKLVVERNTMKRRREMIEAEFILREELDKFRLWQQSLGAIPTIAKLQEKAETLRREEVTKAMKKLTSLSSKDAEVVEKVTKGIVAKLLHGPMNHLRQQTEGGDATRAAIQQVQQAFQLDKEG